MTTEEKSGELEVAVADPQETAALVKRSAQLIERLSDAFGAKNKAEASLEVVRRIIRQAEDVAGHKDNEGQACWCEVREASWEDEHEPGCRAVRHIVRRIKLALEVDIGGAVR